MALCAAARDGDVDAVRRLLAEGADPHERDPRGRTPLHAARGAEVVGLLVAGGASVHAVDRDGRTPLHTAEDAGTARELLAAGADPDARDPQGRTPLHVALRVELIELLLAAGVPVDVLDGADRTPLWYRTSSPVAYHFLPPEEGVRAVRALLAAGADPARRDVTGVAPIHHLRRNPDVLGDGAEAAALRARMREVAEAALGPGLRSRVSPAHACGLAQCAAAVHPRGEEAITATRDGALVRWVLGRHQPRPVEVVGTESLPFRALAPSPDGALLALGSGERQPVELRRWDRLGEVVAVLDVPGSDCLSFSPDGRLLAVGCWSPGGGDGLAVVDVAARRVLAADGAGHGAEALAFAPDGTLVVAWMDDASLLERVRTDLSDVGDGTGEYPGVGCRIESLAFSGDGARLAVCGPGPSGSRSSTTGPGVVALYDAVRRRPEWTVPVDARIKGALQRWHSPVRPRGVCFVAGDRLLAVGLLGGMLVLDAGTGEVVRSSTWWPEDVRTIHAVPGDAAVVVGAGDGFHRLPL